MVGSPVATRRAGPTWMNLDGRTSTNRPVRGRPWPRGADRFAVESPGNAGPPITDLGLLGHGGCRDAEGVAVADGALRSEMPSVPHDDDVAVPSEVLELVGLRRQSIENVRDSDVPGNRQLDRFGAEGLADGPVTSNANLHPGRIPAAAKNSLVQGRSQGVT